MPQFTETEAQCLQKAFDYLNQSLFDGALSPVMLLLHRHRGAQGFFRPNSFNEREKGEFKLHEIALNPDTFAGKTDEWILSVLAHEQCHQWQQEFGKPPRKGYHDKQWANKMEEIGLMPSTTFEEGGKRTGQKVGHYIIPGGPFEVAADNLIAEGFRFALNGIPSVPVPAKKTKIAYVCDPCGVKAWAKPGVKLVCGECGSEMQEEKL
jgi:hypothetical protein